MKRLAFGILVTAAMFMAVEAAGIAQAPRESIVVHGHWTLEVRNVDGSVGERREFENALRPDGGKLLAQILTRQRSVGNWFVDVQGTTPGMFPVDTSSALLAESGWQSSGGEAFLDLSVGVDQSRSKIVLRGTVKATQPGDVVFVLTKVQAPCVVGASDCISQNSAFNFTGSSVKDANDVDKPLHLEKDQSVLVTVVISFTSPAGS